MRIIIPVLEFGRAGGYRVLSELANEWIKCGHEVDFLCPNTSDAPYFPTGAGIIWVDNAGNLGGERATVKAKGWYGLKALYRGLARLGRQYDVILANHSLTAWPIALAACGKARKVYYVQAYEPEYYVSRRNFKGYLVAAVSAFSYHLPLEKIVNSPIYFHYRNLRAAQFVPPGLDLSNFKPGEMTQDLVRRKNNITIGCIGRNEPEKGTAFVLRAFGELNRLDARFVLRIAAYGGLSGGWRHESCEVVMPMNDYELAEYYRSLDILIAPGTVQHGAPHYPVLEAGACGVSVVTTGYMGATPETAWIVKNKDAQSIVETVIEISHDDARRVEKIEKMLDAMQAFSWERVSEKMLGIFDHLIHADG